MSVFVRPHAHEWRARRSKRDEKSAIAPPQPWLRVLDALRGQVGAPPYNAADPADQGRRDRRPNSLALNRGALISPPCQAVDVSSNTECPQLIARKWKYAAPDWRLYDALADERQRWLRPFADELDPQVVEAHRPDRIVFRPWVDPRIDRVEVLITPDGYGSQSIVLVYGPEELRVPSERKLIRYRLGALLGGALRDWVDEGFAAD
jgi:hypothetical protein